MWGTVLAVYVLATGVKGLQLVTGSQWLNDMFNGVALIAALSFAVWRQRAAGRGLLRRRGDRAKGPESSAAEEPAAVGGG